VECRAELYEIHSVQDYVPILPVASATRIVWLHLLMETAGKVKAIKVQIWTVHRFSWGYPPPSVWAQIPAKVYCHGTPGPCKNQW